MPLLPLPEDNLFPSVTPSHPVRWRARLDERWRALRALPPLPAPPTLLHRASGGALLLLLALLLLVPPRPSDVGPLTRSAPTGLVPHPIPLHLDYHAERQPAWLTLVIPAADAPALLPPPRPRPAALTTRGSERWQLLPEAERGTGGQDTAEAATLISPLPAVADADARFALWPERSGAEPYVVQEQDTVEGLATRFGLQPTTILWANEEEGAAELLRLGQTLWIPPLDGVLHTVQAGDTLDSIGALYGGIDTALIAWFPGNGLTLAAPELVEGKRIMVPGGRKKLAVEAPTVAAPRRTGRGGDGYFGWPASGYITTLYGVTHGGIDIADAMHTPIYAAEAGEIVFSGWDNRGYGFAIVINHRNGWSTRYAHLAGMYYEVGTWVERGQLVGLMGSTGRSTGPHVHFELMYRGYRYDPMQYLAGR